MKNHQYIQSRNQKKSCLVGLCFCTNLSTLLPFMIRLFHVQEGMVSLSILHYTIPNGLSKCTLRCGQIVCTSVAPLSSLAQQGMVRLYLLLLPICFQIFWANVLLCSKSFKQKFCFACKMFQKKSCFGPNMFEKKRCFEPKMFEQSLSLHNKHLNKSLALHS